MDHLVASQLFVDELIKRFVGIEGSNDVITITPGMRAFVVRVVVAFAVRIAGDVQPVTGPTFTVPMRA